MKILCVSDQIDPLIYSQNAKKNFSDIDLVLCAGDLPMDYIDFIVTVLNKPTYFIFGNHNLNEYKYYHGLKNQQTTTITGQQIITQPQYATKHDHGAIYIGFKTFASKRIYFLNPKTNKETPLLIAGASGSKQYNKGLNQYSEIEMKLRLFLLVPKLIYNKIRYGRYLDIFLTHATPLNIHDKKDPCHIGFKCYNWFMKTFKPTYLIHGHIHLYDQREERIGKYGDTIVVNAYAHCIITFPTKTN